MKAFVGIWQFWALLSASFAALTAIFAKVGIENINSDFATLIRTIVILGAISVLVAARGEWQPLDEISTKSWVFLVLSGLATGASWACYFRALQIGEAAKVQSVDKLSVVLVAIFSVIFLSEKLTLLHVLGIVMVAGGTILLAL